MLPKDSRVTFSLVTLCAVMFAQLGCCLPKFSGIVGLMKNEPQWDRLGDFVRRARGAKTQKAIAKAGGPSDTTLAKIEAKMWRPSRGVDDTLEKLDIGLGWEPGSAAEILNGGHPTPTRPTLDQFFSEESELEARRAEIEHLGQSASNDLRSLTDPSEALALRRRLADVTAERDILRSRPHIHAEEQRLQKLADLWLKAQPLNHPVAMTSGQLVDSAVELARAVAAYAEREVGGYSRMRELAEALIDQRRRAAGQTSVFDDEEENRDGMEAAAQSDASAEGGQGQEAVWLKRSDHDLAARDVGYKSEGRRIREKQDREAEDPA